MHFQNNNPYKNKANDSVEQLLLLKLRRVTKPFDVLSANSLQMNSDVEIRANQARVVAFVPCSPPIFLFFL